MFCQILVAMCHIFPTCSSWEILNCLQVHIVFLSLVCDGDFQPASKERSHKHNVSKTQTLKLWREHFLLNHIRPIFIWNKGCKTTKERTPMIPDYIFPCVVFWGVLTSVQDVYEVNSEVSYSFTCSSPSSPRWASCVVCSVCWLVLILSAVEKMDAD